MGIDPLKVKVTSRTAMGISTFYSAVNLISDIIASQPYSVFQNLENGGIASGSDHPLHYLIHTRPNRHMSSFVFRKMMYMNMLVHGHAIAQIIRDKYYRPVALRPFQTKDVQVYEDPYTGYMFFKVVTEPQLVLSEDDVIQIKDVAFDGKRGTSIIDWQAGVLKLGTLARQFSEKNFEKGAFMAGFVTAPLQPTDGEAAKIYKERIMTSLRGDEYGGFGLAVLGQGADFVPVTRSMVESAVIQIFDQSDKDIAKMFRVPLIMLGDTDKSTSFGKGIDSMYILLTNNVIIPKVIQFEQEVDYKCLTKSESLKGYYTKMNLRSLLKGDAATYAEYVAKMLQNGIYTINEIRRFDEMSPVDGGDRNWIQQNMMPVDRADEILTSKYNGKGSTQGDEGAEVPDDSESES